MAVPWNDYYQAVTTGFSTVMYGRAQQNQAGFQKSAQSQHGLWSDTTSRRKTDSELNNQWNQGRSQEISGQESLYNAISTMGPSSFMQMFGHGRRAANILNALPDYVGGGGGPQGWTPLNNAGYGYPMQGRNPAAGSRYNYDPAVIAEQWENWQYDPPDIYSQGKGLEGRTSGFRPGADKFGFKEGTLVSGKGKIGILPDKPQETK